MTIAFVVNGRPVVLETDPLRRLIDVLREDLGLTGVKEGCGEGECGACSVLIDERPALACIVAVGAVEGRHVVTIEGYQERDLFRKVASAFSETGRSSADSAHRG
jgi:carbon-monoxide dehydrogenase small subunit